MSTSNLSLLNLDPTHISCIGGRTVLTCRNCAGNASRVPGSNCTTCEGKGFNIFICPHCNPTAAAISVRASPSVITASMTPGSSGPSSPASLSGNPSMSYSDSRAPRSWKLPDTTGRGGRIETNTPPSL